jgi:GNAT superfamily N-acetyltransferase
MPPEYEITELHKQQEPEYMEILSAAFHDLPQIPALIEKPKHTKTLIRNLFKLYEKTGSIKTFGIQKDNALICVGVCIDSDSTPSLFRTITFGFSLFRTLGIKGVQQLWMYNRNKPTYDKKCLELIFYGTRASFQQKGYGRAMLNFLYDYAKKNGYGGVTGVTNTSRPAFHFYMRDGWIVDRKFVIENYTICWVRRIVQ